MPKTKIKVLEGYEKELVSSGLKKKGLVITVSGLSGSGKSSVVKMLMGAFPKLKLVYAGDIFRENARKAGMSLEEYCRTRNEQDDMETDKETLRRAITGNAVIDARLAGWVMGDWADARIFVACPFETRAKRVAKRENIPLAAARKRLKDRDIPDEKRYRELYGIDISDMGIYDYVIDNSGSFEELECRVRKVAEEIRKSL